MLDTDTGLYYYHARYYDPEIARFVQADTVLPTTTSQGLNRYTYCINNPLIYTDPSGNDFGLSALLISVAVGAMIGSAIGAGSAAIMGGNIGQGAMYGAISGAIGGCFGYIGYQFGGPIGAGVAGAASGALSSLITGGDIGQGAIIGGIAGLTSGVIRDNYGSADPNSSDPNVVQAQRLQETSGDPNVGCTGNKASVIDPNSVTQNAGSSGVSSRTIKKVLGIYDAKPKTGLFLADSKDFKSAAKATCDEVIGITDGAHKGVKEIQSWLQANPQDYPTDVVVFAHGGPMYVEMAGRGTNQYFWKNAFKNFPSDTKIHLVCCDVAKGSRGMRTILKIANWSGRQVFAYDGKINYSTWIKWTSTQNWKAYGHAYTATPGSHSPLGLLSHPSIPYDKK